MRALTASSIVILASITLAAPPKTAYEARVIGAPDEDLQFSDGVASWRCEGGACRGEAPYRMSDEAVCAALSAQVGPINAFANASSGVRFHSDALFLCNAEGGKLRSGRGSAPAPGPERIR